MSASPAAASLPHTVVSALGGLLIPSAPGDPGYKDLEQYGITDYVLNKLKLTDEMVDAFNNAAKVLFEYLSDLASEMILNGAAPDAKPKAEP